MPSAQLILAVIISQYERFSFQSVPNHLWEEKMENKVIYVLVLMVHCKSLLKQL